MNQNNPFANLSTEGLEAPKDVLGGNFQPLESGIYTGTVKAFYAGKSDAGAHNMTLVFETEVGGQKREYRETVYVTNKQGENSYADKQDASKRSPLPGFTTANDIALVTTGQALGEQDFEEKVVNIRNFDLKQDVPTKVQMAVDVIGKQVTLAILRVKENKKVKVGNDYVPTEETRESNTIDKVFHTESGRTVSEIVRKLETGEFQKLWAEKNNGVTRDKTTKGAGTAGAPGRPTAPVGDGAAKKGPSLFG